MTTGYEMGANHFNPSAVGASLPKNFSWSLNGANSGLAARDYPTFVDPLVALYRPCDIREPGRRAVLARSQ